MRTLCGTILAAVLSLSANANSVASFCERAEKGERLTVAFLGGSLSWGANATNPNKTSWRARIGERLEGRYPDAHFKFVDAAIGGTNSQLGIFRLERDVIPYKPDLVFVEWLVNDGTLSAGDNRSCSYEGIVRHLLERLPDCVPVQVMLPTRATIEEQAAAKLPRWGEQKRIGAAYGLVCADVLGEMRKRYAEGKIDLDKIWPALIGDDVHPHDFGYGVYADIVWENVFANPSPQSPTLAKEWLFAPKYRHLVRENVAEWKIFPKGWHRDYCSMRAGTFDFLCSRWQDGLAVAANCAFNPKKQSRELLPGAVVEPLRATFRGEVLMLYGESAVQSSKCEVYVDGVRVSQKDTSSFGKAFAPSAYLVWQIGNGFDADREHTLEIHPVFDEGEPQEFRLGSICVAGRNAAWVRPEVILSASDATKGSQYEKPTGELQEKAQALADLAVKEGLQGALQFCAFKDGKCIVDVWAGTMTTNAGAAKIDGDTLFPIFSTEKPLLATVVHRSVEQGKLEYDRPVSNYWPEFKGGGKELLTVRELLGYRSGLPDGKPDTGFDLKSIDSMSDWKGMLDWFASCEPEIEPGTKQRYMPRSYGWALGGLLENAWGRPANEILREQVLAPAGIENDFYFVCGDKEIGRIATVYNGTAFETMNNDVARRSLLPSAWAVSSARGIAKFYNRLCGFDGQPPLISKSTLDAALKPCRHESDPLPDAEGLKKWHMIFGMGYGLWGESDDISRVFGHGGVGGSEGLCDRSQRLVIGYTCNFDNAPPKLREAFYSLVGMRWRYWKDDVNIQDLQMATVAKGNAASASSVASFCEKDAANRMAAAAAPSNSSGCDVSFGGINGEEFIVDGRSIQIRAGELEPQRIPRDYWGHRVRMCKAMGLNAISSYFAWNDFEQADGSFDFKTGNRDVAAFLSLCKDEGMWVLFRPGPYICAEWDFGGLPPRLLAKDMEIRSSDPRYLAEAEKYLSAIAEIAEPFLAKNGGPIVLTQIENEYGSWPFKKDKDYLKWLKDFWKARGFGPFYMADGAGDKFLKDLIYPDKEIAVGFDPAMNDEDWSFARKYNPCVPILSSETYPGWLRHWGEGNWKPSDISGAVKWFMEGRRSFCFFVAHGGTSFGFMAGANDGGEGGYEPDLTSYDYGSPIDEQGRPTKAFFDYRAIIFGALGETPPPVPDAIASMSFDPVVPARIANLRNGLGQETSHVRPPTFEQMGQNQGMAFYRTALPSGDAAELTFDRVADYAQIWFDGRRIATVDRRQKLTPIQIPARTREAELEVVVEAMGHINFGKGMKDDRKGIVGDVKLDGKPLENWRVALKPLSEKSIVDAKPASYDGYAGGHFRATLKLDEVADTYIDMSKWRKGTIYVNGYNLGRYWSVGPQYSLYCPAPFLRKGDNEIDIVELELAEPKPIQGLPRPLVRASEVDTENAANVW